MSLSLQSKALSYMIDYIDKNYARSLNELLSWQDYFPDFVCAISAQCGGLFDSIVGLVDWHFQRVAPPGVKNNFNPSVGQHLLASRCCSNSR